MKTAPTRPILRYHGGKWLLAPWIISHFPKHRVYVEPFGGGASVLLRKERSYAEVYNDLDTEIVHLFQVVRDAGDALARALELTPFSRVEFNGAYRPSEDLVEKARRTVIRSFQGFGADGVHSSHRTGFRSNSNRAGTTPASDWVGYPDCLRLIIERLRGVVIEHRDAFELIPRHDAADALFYVDPPYVHATRKRVDKARGYRHEMTDDDHRRLAEMLRAVRGKVVVSGYACDLYDRELFHDWRRVDREALADGARKRTEVLWMNFQPEGDLFG
jgi:DNA adenine methylase